MATAIVAAPSTWTAARRKSDGKAFFYVPGTNGAMYMTAADGCTCPAARYSKDGSCKHQAAVQQHQAAVQQHQAPRPTCLRKGCENETAGRTRLCAPCLRRQNELLANA